MFIPPLYKAHGKDFIVFLWVLAAVLGIICTLVWSCCFPDIPPREKTRVTSTRVVSPGITGGLVETGMTRGTAG